MSLLMNDDNHCHNLSLILLALTSVYFYQIQDCDPKIPVISDPNFPAISEASETSSQKQERKAIVWLSAIGLLFWVICPIASTKFKYFKLLCCLLAAIVAVLTIHYLYSVKLGLCNTDNFLKFLKVSNYNLIVVFVSFIYLFVLLQKILVGVIGTQRTK